MNKNLGNWKLKGYQPTRLAARVTAPLAMLTLLPLGSTFAQDGVVSTRVTDAAAQARAAMEYWTAERMESAIPMPMPNKYSPEATTVRESALPPDAVPGVCPGWKPGSTPQPDPFDCQEVSPDRALNNGLIGFAQPQTSPPFSPPANPTDYGNYAPFNRWTWFGAYVNYPTSTIGKLFFTQNGLNYVCSGSVIQRSTIATAGHCLSDGAGNWSTNVVFCPSYNRGSGSGAPNPTRGCWAWTGYAATSSAWFYTADVDYDYSCFVTNPYSTVVNSRIGDVTGWTGRAWNWPTRQSTFAWGYPAASPFPGYHIITTVSTEWYEIDWGTGGQVSKYIGSDQTGGSSGGPWWFGIRHTENSFEYPDTDGSGDTDPGQGNSTAPFINGVNSHRRCSDGSTPQTCANTLYKAEIGSAQFLSNPGDQGESEDVFALCFANQP